MCDVPVLCRSFSRLPILFHPTFSISGPLLRQRELTSMERPWYGLSDDHYPWFPCKKKHINRINVDKHFFGPWPMDMTRHPCNTLSWSLSEIRFSPWLVQLVARSTPGSTCAAGWSPKVQRFVGRFHKWSTGRRTPRDFTIRYYRFSIYLKISQYHH